MEDVKKYPIGGYAPGNYQCRCITCKSLFFGDKRACQCEDCATEMYVNINIGQPNQPVSGKASK
jgi:hypothetical protein